MSSEIMPKIIININVQLYRIVFIFFLLVKPSFIYTCIDMNLPNSKSP